MCICLALWACGGTQTPIRAPDATSFRLDASVRPLRYALAVTVDPQQVEFSGTIAIDVALPEGTDSIRLHAEGLKIEATTVDGSAAPSVVAGGLLHLDVRRRLTPLVTRIEIRYRGSLNVDTSEGLFRQTVDGLHYVFTQLAPTAARRAFPCFDEPGLKAPWDITVHAPARHVVLSNAPIAKQVTTQGRQTVTFATTPPLPSFLVAIAVGPFELVDLGTAGQARIPMRLAVPRGRAADAAFARQVHGPLLDRLEAYLGVPYPFSKLDAVAIPNFVGGMENAGLISYAEALILARPAEESDEFRRTHALLAAHEMAHQWFGNHVTIAWWDDLWLSESFATFLADQIVEEWRPTWGLTFRRLERLQDAFAADSLATARALRQPVSRPDQIAGVFDVIAYKKGSALLTMVERWLGELPFRAGLRTFLLDHAGGTATTSDFIDALASVGPAGVSEVLHSFLSQPGVPLVTLSLACDGRTSTLEVQQTRMPPGSTTANSTWAIPLCVAAADSSGVHETCNLVTQRRQTVSLPTTTCPQWIDGNPDHRGYYRVQAADPATQGAPAPMAQASLLLDRWALVEAGMAPLRELVDPLLAAAAAQDPTLLATAIGLMQRLAPYVPDDQHPSYQRMLARLFGPAARSIGWRATPGEPFALGALRIPLLNAAGLLGQDPALIAEARAVSERFLDAPASLDPWLAGLALATASRSGDLALAQRLATSFAASHDTNHRIALLSGLAWSGDVRARLTAFTAIGAGELTLDELDAITAAAADPERRDELYHWMTENLEAVQSVFPPPFRAWVVGYANLYCDAAHLEALDTWWAPRTVNLPGGPQRLSEAKATMTACIAIRGRLADDLIALLAAGR